MKAQELRKALDRPNDWDDEVSTLFSPSDTVASLTATEVNFVAGEDGAALETVDVVVQRSKSVYRNHPGHSAGNH